MSMRNTAPYKPRIKNSPAGSPYSSPSKYGSFKQPSFDDEQFRKQTLLDERYQDEIPDGAGANRYADQYDERQYFSAPKEQQVQDRAPAAQSPIAVSARKQKIGHQKTSAGTLFWNPHRGLAETQEKFSQLSHLNASSQGEESGVVGAAIKKKSLRVPGQKEQQLKELLQASLPAQKKKPLEKKTMSEDTLQLGKIY